jgi:two-component system nitrogen regulation response regulator GlnG
VGTQVPDTPSKQLRHGGCSVSASSVRATTDSTEMGRAIAEAIPALVDQLLASRPGRVRRDILSLVERAVFARVLAVTGGNQLRAARLLGMNRNTLHKHCRQLNLVSPRAEVDGQTP